MAAGNSNKRAKQKGAKEPKSDSDKDTTRDSNQKNTETVELLLATLITNNKDVVPTSISTLQTFFLARLDAGEILSKTKAAAAESEEEYSIWLRHSYLKLKENLLQLLSGDAIDSSIQIKAFTALMELVRSEMPGTFANGLYTEALGAMVSGSGFNEDVLGLLLGRITKYADMRYYTWVGIQRIAEDVQAKRKWVGAEAGAAAELARNLYDVAMNAPAVFVQCDPAADAEYAQQGTTSWATHLATAPAPAAPVAASKKRKKDAEAQDSAEAKLKWASPKDQRKAFTSAWLAFLKLGIPDDIYNKVLTKMHVGIVPHMINPVLLSDFLTHSLTKGGMAGMLALNGIFILVQEHGLEYPQFYDKLYELLTEEALRAKYRKRFFDLMDVFLRSPMIPAYVAAAFAKRFARHALTSTPTGTVIALTFVHNLVRRHFASVGPLVHRESAPALQQESPAGSSVSSQLAEHDPFLPAAVLPKDAGALASSLWELEALRVHACPQVKEFTKAFDKDLSNRKFTADLPIQEVTRQSYKTMMDQEMERKMKRAPLAFYKTIPNNLIGDQVIGPGFVGWDTTI